VTLTEEGARIAEEVQRRHVLIRDFLTGVLSLPEDKAEVTACRLEHVLEPDVLAHFAAIRSGNRRTAELAPTVRGRSRDPP